MSEENNFIIGMTFVVGILGIGMTFSIFIMKQIADIKKAIAKLCERIAKEETKSDIYHSPHELEDK